MARKSRRKVNQIPSESIRDEMAIIDQTLTPTAAYIRLSSIDEGRESIESQMRLVQKFIRQNRELQLADTYIDNGYTGTNFDRPEFDRMMQDVRAGRIKCIVVKDLSRFGRNYLEMGYYLETIFPRLNVRFIAVTDDFDSSRPDDLSNISVPIKNIVNNYYANDISKKLVTANEARRKKGDFRNGMAPYGYNINKENRAFVIDEDTACYVRVIYQWFLMGVSKAEIARRLDLVEAPRPCETKGQDKYVKKKEKGTRWLPCTVGEILSNMVYAGDMAGGRYRSAKYKGQKLIRVRDPEEWVVRRDTHPAIVLRSDFDDAQQRSGDINAEYYAKRNPRKIIKENPFSGIIYCGCCGGHMKYQKKKDSKETFGVFFCKKKKQDSPCGQHSITENLLKIMVMDQIHILIQTACEKKQLAKDILTADTDNSSVISLKKKITSLSGQIAQTEKRLANLYEDYGKGLFDKEEYQYMKEHYIIEKQEKEEKMKEVQEKLHKLQKKAESCLEFSNQMEKYADTRTFDEALVRDLVESIAVGMDNTLNITFKCEDVYQELMDSLEAVNDEE